MFLKQINPIFALLKNTCEQQLTRKGALGKYLNLFHLLRNCFSDPYVNQTSSNNRLIVLCSVTNLLSLTDKTIELSFEKSKDVSIYFATIKFSVFNTLHSVHVPSYDL